MPHTLIARDLVYLVKFPVLPRKVARLTVICLLLFVSPAAAENWQHRSTPQFSFHFLPRDASLASTLTGQAETIFQTITADVGYTPQRSIEVYLCPTPETFRQQQVVPGTAPDWAVGLAYPGQNRILLRSTLTPEEGGGIRPLDIFTHELAHIVLEQALATGGGAPRWLSEGFSMYHARQWTLHGQRVIEEVTLRQQFIPLSLLTTRFPTNESTARIAYAQSFSLVAFLLNNYGRDIFHNLIENLARGWDTDTALRGSVGINLAQLEQQWQASLQDRYSWFAYLGKSRVLWVAASVLFVLAYLIKRRRAQRVQARWEAEEEDEPQFHL